jgi:hypothetical protein
VPRASVNALAFAFNSTTSVDSASSSSSSSSSLLQQNSVESRNQANISGGEIKQDAQAVEPLLRANATAAAARLVANSIVERYVADEDSGGHIDGDPASEQARQYLRR